MVNATEIDSSTIFTIIADVFVCVCVCVCVRVLGQILVFCHFQANRAHRICKQIPKLNFCPASLPDSFWLCARFNTSIQSFDVVL